MGKHTKIAVMSVIALLLVGFGYWYFSLSSPKLPIPPLKDLAKARNIELGVHVLADRLDNRIYADIVKSQFAFINIDGGIHFSDVQPSQGNFDFTESDKIVAFAEANDMPVQLHHLVWGDDSRLPAWLTEGNFTEEELKAILQNHITTIVSRYKGRIKEYTVVNEPFTEAQNVYGLNDWFAERISGYPNFMDNYFIWARQADPQAKLLINDFNNETKNSVSDAMFEYVKSAKARGVPIDGVGMQLHIDASKPFDTQAVVDNMNRFGEIGATVYITEFDVNTNFVKGNAAYKSQLEAQLSYEAARACIESNACVSFNVFGVSSKNDLLKRITRAKSRDYLFDSRYRPRPSFYSFRQAWLQP